VRESEGRLTRHWERRTEPRGDQGLRAPDGAPARTSYSVERRFIRPDAQPFTLLNVNPYTGRKHQIESTWPTSAIQSWGTNLCGDEDLYLALWKIVDPEQRRRLMLPHHALHAANCDSRGAPRAGLWAEPEPWFVAFLGSNLEEGG